MQIVGQTWLNLVTWTCGSWSEGQHDLYFTVQWFCLISSIWCMYIILWDYESVWPEVWPQNKCRSLWPIFHGPVIWPYILKVIWCMNILIWDYESVWPDFWPQNICKSLWPIFHGPVILRYILKTYWCMNIILWDYGSVWPQNKCRSLWPIYFMVQWSCLISPTLFDAWVSYFQIMRQCDPNFDLKINIGQHDLYFMVLWFCLISTRLFDGLTS